MKQKLWIVILMGVVLPAVVLAASWLDQGPTPKQMYRDVNSISNGDKSQAQLQSQSNADQKTVSSAPSIEQTPSVALTSTQVNAARLNVLSTKLDSLTSQVAQLNQSLSMLNQEMNQLEVSDSAGNTASHDIESHIPTDDGSFLSVFANWLSQVDPNMFVGFGGAGVLLLGIGFLVGRGKSRENFKDASANTPHSIADDQDAIEQEIKESESEYDFMGTNEAIPAMLDLARSYLVMDNANDAKSVLEKVLQRGDEAQRNEAKELLQEIAKKNNE